MIIRTATHQDIPAIVELLKASVGESLMPKSEAFWKWKHVANPFGESRVLVAEDNEKIIGVRSFMNWDWRGNGAVIKSLRAVDTGTFPEYQGRGVFKSLNARLVSENELRVEFIFNTPNKKTEAGNLKLGWFKYTRMPIRIRVCPLNFLHRQSPGADMLNAILLKNVLDKIQPDQLTAWTTGKNSHWTSHVTADYLQWRYVEIPGISYYGVLDSIEKSFLLIFRIKVSRKGISEVRICDVLYDRNFNHTVFKQHVDAMLTLVRPSFVSISKGLSSDMNGVLNRLGFLPALPIGPQITVRSMSREMNSNMLDQHWRPSIGDIEIF